MGIQVADAPVTESNMVHYLGEVEQLANRVLAEYADVRDALLTSAGAGDSRPLSMSAADSSSQVMSPSKSMASILGTGPKVPMGHDGVHVNPPKLDDYQSDEEDEDDEEEARPLTRDELKARTLTKLQRRGGGQGGNKGKANKAPRKSMGAR